MEEKRWCFLGLESCIAVMVWRNCFQTEKPRLRPSLSQSFIVFWLPVSVSPTKFSSRCPNPPSWNNPLSVFKLFRKPFKLGYAPSYPSLCLKDRTLSPTHIRGCKYLAVQRNPERDEISYCCSMILGDIWSVQFTHSCII